MNVLIVNSSDINGGAARAANRLHKALLSQNINSQMLVQRKAGDDYNVIVKGGELQKSLNRLRPNLDSIPLWFYKNRLKSFFSPSWLPFSNVVKLINEINPDIVHLHWITGGMIKIEELAKINAPIVWSLHDNWAFTGGCHIMLNCEKYRHSCGACPILGSKKNNDLSNKIFIRKQKTFSCIKNLTINGLSRWMSKCAKQSELFKGKNVITIPNPIDTERFNIFDKKESRGLWRFPLDRKLVLFGAINATNDLNKGFNVLIQAFRKFKSTDVDIVVFGATKPEGFQDFGFKTHYLGCLHDDVSLVTLYNAVDVLIVPSSQENLSNVIMESLSCGNPVVAFDVGGNRDLIEHKKNGYLVKAFESDDLVTGIKWVLNTHNYEKLKEYAREKVLKEFDSKVVTKKYIKLYEDILKYSKPL